MPSTGHGVNTRTKTTRQDSDGGRPASDRQASGSAAKREATALQVPVNNSTPLSAVSDHLPSLSTIHSLRAFLPHVSPQQVRPRAGLSDRSALDETRTGWQYFDLQDGQGKCRYLVVVSRSRGLQIWRFSSSELPQDAHVPESFPAPHLTFHLARLPPANGANAEQFMLEARVLEGYVVPAGGAALAVLSQSLPASRRDPTRSFALGVIGMRNGKLIKRFDLGEGRSASLRSSRRAIAVAVCGAVPELFVLDATTLSFLPSSIADLAFASTSDCAAFDLSGRLLAYLTSEAPRVLGPLGLGSVVCGPSVQRGGPRLSPNRVSISASEQPRDASTALMTAAVQIGGGVARGLWAGISKGAKAAELYRARQLARSAPSEATGSMMEAGEAEAEPNHEDDAETRSLGESSPIDEPVVADAPSKAALWVGVVDLGASGSDRPVRTVAHFRLPPSQAFFSPANLHSPIPQTHREGGTPISRLSFSPDGTQLLIAQADGRSFHVVSIDPSIPHQHMSGDPVHGHVRHLYELKRGTTPSEAREVIWDRHGRWVGVGTARGTIHIWPIHPLGSTADPTTHARPGFMNPSGPGALSTVVSPIQRLRASAGRAGMQGEEGEVRLDQARSFAFTDYRSDPIGENSVYQDMVIVQPFTSVVDIMRLVLCPKVGLASYDRPAGDGAQRGSALSETIRANRAKQPNALSMRHVTLAKWLLDTGNDEGSILLDAGEDLVLAGRPSGNSVAQAELQTHSTSSRVLPASIYLSKQVEFFAAKAIDEYSPLSIMDAEARTRRLIFRSEVQVLPVSESAGTTLDVPLQHAIHEVIDERPEAQIPGLPNGYTRGTKWTEALPIKQVAAGLGGGVDRVRREYARAQRSRSTRRETRAAANALSFEDDSVLAVSMEDQAGSVPSSEDAPVPMTDDGSASGAEGDENEWRDQWEEEYRRAVEDDGGPDDLVLGLLDEEQEKWEARRKVLAGQYTATASHSNRNKPNYNPNDANIKNTSSIKTSGTRGNKKK